MRRNDNPRATRLLDDHGDAVFRFCLRLCAGRHADAEDLAQETLIAGLDGLPRFLGRARLRTWLFSIALNRWRRLRERQARETPTDVAILDALRDGAASFSPSPERQALRDDLDTAISRLPDPLREAFVLVKAEGFTHKEAAGLLGAPQGTVQSRVFDACRRLRESLEPEPEDEPFFRIAVRTTKETS